MVPKLPLDRLKQGSGDRSLANKENDKSLASKNQLSESELGDLLMSVQGSDAQWELSAKENAYLTKVINHEVQSSRMHSKSNPLLIAKHRSSVTHVDEDVFHLNELDFSKEIISLAESYR